MHNDSNFNQLLIYLESNSSFNHLLLYLEIKRALITYL